MNNDLLKLILSNYDIKGVKDISENTDGANKVYFICLENNVKYVAKLYTRDIIPSVSILNVIETLSKNNNLIPKFIKNKDGVIVTKNKDNVPVVLTTFIEGEMLGDDIVDWRLCADIVDLLTPLHQKDVASFNTDFWYEKAIVENQIDFKIKTDLSRCRLSLVHGDLNHMNILVKNKKLSGIIDWDGLHKDYLVTDLAIFAAHNLLKPRTKNLVKEFIRFYNEKAKLSSYDNLLYYEFIKIRIKQIVSMLEKRRLDVPASSKTLNKYIAVWEDKINLLN